MTVTSFVGTTYLTNCMKFLNTLFTNVTNKLLMTKYSLSKRLLTLSDLKKTKIYLTIWRDRFLKIIMYLNSCFKPNI